MGYYLMLLVDESGTAMKSVVRIITYDNVKDAGIAASPCAEVCNSQSPAHLSHEAIERSASYKKAQ